MVDPDAELVIYVSGGAETVKVPDVVGWTNNDATNELEKSYGLKTTHSFEASDDVEKDQVIRTDPVAGSEVAMGSTVNIVVSNGPDIKSVAVPDVRNSSEAAAKSTLESYNLALGSVTHENSDSVDAGLIIRQGISPGTTVNEGTTVDIVISDGKKEVKYTGSVSGSISLTDAEAIDYVNEQASVTVEVYLNTGNATYTVYSNTLTGASAFPVTIGGSQSNLSSGEGSVTYQVKDAAGNDITSLFSGSLSSSFTQQ
jgi:serine/threonine-protein kinase